MLRTMVAGMAVLALAACSADARPQPTPVAAPAEPPAPRLPATPTRTAPSHTPQPSPTAAPTATPTTIAPPPIRPRFSYPIGAPGQPPGDGFIIRHGFQTENTWYNPGYWHTG